MIGAYEKFAETSMIVSPKLAAEGIPSIVGVVDVKCHLRTFVNGPADFGVEFSSNKYASTSSQIHGAMKCSDAPSEASPDYLPTIRSGSFAAIGSREFMEDEHICVDDLSTHLGHILNFPTSFYGVFDGHGGSAAATYIKKNAIKFFFEDAELPQTDTHDASFLEELANCHRKSYQQADIALSTEITVSSTCGTTALTAIVIGRHLLIANAGDCRAVLCRRGVAFDMSDDHRPTHAPERRRVEEFGDFIDDMDYLNGELSVTRALGDWFLKPSALICDPEVRQLALSDEDEFLIIGCDGIWDVVPSQVAVSLVRRGLRRHDDPSLCAKELVMEAARLESNDNLTVIVVCFGSVKACEGLPVQRPLVSRMSDEALERLKCAFDAE